MATRRNNGRIIRIVGINGIDPQATGVQPMTAQAHDDATAISVEQVERRVRVVAGHGEAAREGPDAAFHRADAAGYVFWADQVLALDAINELGVDVLLEKVKSNMQEVQARGERTERAVQA